MTSRGLGLINKTKTPHVGVNYWVSVCDCDLCGFPEYPTFWADKNTQNPINDFAGAVVIKDISFITTAPAWVCVHWFGYVFSISV